MPPSGRATNPTASVPNDASVPASAEYVGKKSLPKTSAAVKPYRKKSYHSRMVPSMLATATLRTAASFATGAYAVFIVGPLRHALEPMASQDRGEATPAVVLRKYSFMIDTIFSAYCCGDARLANHGLTSRRGEAALRSPGHFSAGASSRYRGSVAIPGRFPGDSQKCIDRGRQRVVCRTRQCNGALRNRLAYPSPGDVGVGSIHRQARHEPHAQSGGYHLADRLDLTGLEPHPGLDPCFRERPQDDPTHAAGRLGQDEGFGSHFAQRNGIRI